jgi:ADP-ribose pyrophosphatase
VLKTCQRPVICWLSHIVKGESEKTGNHGKWTVRSTRTVFEGVFFTVFEDRVIKPTGDDGTYATISFTPGVSVLPIDEEENVYLTRQFRYAIGRHDIEVLSGSIDGQSALEAAQRESREEMGIEADEWIDVGTVHSLTSLTRCSSHQFIARRLKFNDQEPEGTEEIEPVRMKLAEACEMVDSGNITDADTCILILKAIRLKEKWQ